MVVQGRSNGPKPAARNTNQPRIGRVHAGSSASTPASGGRQSNIHTTRSYPQQSAIASTSDGETPQEIPQMYGRPRTVFSFREMFFPYYKLWSITTAILVINLIYFIATLIYAGVKYDQVFDKSNRMGGPSALALRDCGAKWAPYIVDGHVWRLITPIFMHNGLLHIAMNSFFAARFCWLAEVRFTPIRFSAIYLVAGIGGVVCSCLLARNSVSAGASGALFGILGAHVYFAIRHLKYLRNGFMEIFILAFIILLNVLIGFLGPGGTDNWAHLGGCLFGVLMAGALCKIWHRDTEPKMELIYRGVSAALCLSLMVVFLALVWVLAP